MTEPHPAPVRLRPEIANLPPYKQGRPAPVDGFKLSSNENPFPPHPAVLAAIHQANSEINRYPDASALTLRSALADRFGVTADEVVIGAGSVSLLLAFIEAACAAGDEVIYAWRSFEAYPGLSTVAGATSVRVPNRADAGHDLDAMAAAVTDRTRVIIVCSPNNPTGPAVTAAEFERFMAAVPADRLVLLDEAYAEFVHRVADGPIGSDGPIDGDPFVDGSTLIGRYPNLVILRTFSKAYGLAGLRVGYAIGPKVLLDASRATLMPLSITAAATAAALASLDPEVEPTLRDQVATIARRRDELAAALRAQGWQVPDSQANFVWLATGERTAEIADRLFDGGVVVRAFPPEGIRISVGEAESVETLLRILSEVV